MTKVTNLRVMGGSLRGREILSPKMTGTHPMGARERNALFNMLTGWLTGARVLDAYAGTGVLGIEALSRGASSATFVEKNVAVARVLKQNLANLGLTGVSEVRIEEVGRFLAEKQGSSEEKCGGWSGGITGAGNSEAGTYDVILVDPPYGKLIGVTEVGIMGEVEKLTQLLNDTGILALSHPGEAPEITGAELIKTKRYAGARISLYRTLA